MFLKNNVINRDGWRFNGDPCKLGVVTFDGYRIKPTKGENSCWYAVLVWSGRKPSPRFCATRDDLTSSTYYKRSVSSFLIFRTFVYDFIPINIRHEAQLRSQLAPQVLTLLLLRWQHLTNVSLLRVESHYT